MIFIDSIDKHQPLFKLLQYIIICVGERGIVNSLLIFQISYFIPRVILLFQYFIQIVCCTIILSIFIIVIIGRFIFNCMIHYNVALYVIIKANISQLCGPVEIIGLLSLKIKCTPLNRTIQAIYTI